MSSFETWLAFFFSFSELSAVSLSERTDSHASLYSEGLLQFYPTVNRGHSCTDKDFRSLWKCFCTHVFPCLYSFFLFVKNVLRTVTKTCYQCSGTGRGLIFTPSDFWSIIGNMEAHVQLWPKSMMWVQKGLSLSALENDWGRCNEAYSLGKSG